MTVQLVEELGRELDELRAFKSQSLSLPSSITHEPDASRTHCWELEELVNSLRQVHLRNFHHSPFMNMHII